ncbi:sugar ABC transporter substrate-binding protein [Coraliomargarita sp. SDUM461004]|uniref:Sugar ABC transporter substrate-binding protein n=1 Tax=Thalassobacterium sedimentorum TaxID=3041258 RepID=A0ABU1ADS5_9BACT|nr:sugar ABC transporter substrate-binding protein [Coraliomargarita sp. SDUM461004]MDQ8192841.1 sugar ABC transporter substrate-binding protein [Coraliomargarita sp. SDUM461004]
MRKKLIGLFTLLASLFIVGCGQDNEGASKDNDQIKIGMTVQSLSNPTWAGYCQAIEKEVKAQGASINYVACDSNVSKQITQIENFISSGVDVIIIHPADPKGVEFALKQARDTGIKVLAWDDNLKNADLAWLIDNHELGYTIGEHAAKWINEKLGGSAEVAILNYPQLPILLERGNGIRDAIIELAPKAKIVAESSAIDTKEGIEKMETIFQSNPNVKVVCSIGGGGSVGANEAAKAAAKITDDFGIFAADATQPELSAMKNNEGIRMTVTVTGTNTDIAKEIWDMVTMLHSGAVIESKEIYREFIPVTQDNVDAYLGK